MNTTLYSTGPACMKCRMTKKNMEGKGIVPDYVLLTDPAFVFPADVQPIFDQISAEKGGAPIVVVRDESGQIIDWWNDFRPDKITALAAQLSAVAA